jgi:D-xylonolactonase
MNILPVAVARIEAELGEGPAWDAARQCLWFVDIKKHLLYRFDPASGALQTWKAPDQIGWALPAADGSLLAGVRGGLYRFEPASGQFVKLVSVEPDVPGNRLNDATTDATGALWFGSMDDAEEQLTGRIYRLAEGRVQDSGLAPVCITNGPAVSPDGTTLYHVDTLGRRILASRLNAGRLPCDTRVFAIIEDGAGYPDGPTVDSQGFVWIGLFAGWSARRYNPDGRLVDTVEFPVANITKLAFGGPDLRTAYVTTARKGLSMQELAAQPLAGSLFSFPANVPGLVQPVICSSARPLVSCTMMSTNTSDTAADKA